MKTIMISEKIWIVVPSYNHGTEIVSVLKAIPDSIRNIIVVDDGSEKKISRGDLPPDSRIALLSHDSNCGKGAALLTAAKFALDKKGDFMISLDADGQHAPEEISCFIEILAGGFNGLVIGARDFKGKKIPWTSRLGRMMSNLMVFLETGRRINDTQSGFRLYPLGIFKSCDCRSSGYEFETELLVRSIWGGYECRTVPISVEYPRNRISHFKLFQDNVRFVVLHFRLICWAVFRSRNDWETKDSSS